MCAEKQTVSWRDLLRPLMTCQKDLNLILQQLLKESDQILQTVGDDAQLANVDIQNVLQKQMQVVQMMSNISKMLHDTTMAIIRKIGS